MASNDRDCVVNQIKTFTGDVTKWDCSVVESAGGPVASLTVTTNGSTVSPFRIKGVCYSPCPIGGSNNNAANIGDWFWDSYTDNGTTITSWEQTWTNDLQNIKALGVNTIRVYCMLGTQLPETWNSGIVYTHQKFLDACYDNGIYVLVGFPLPTQLFDQGEVPSPSQAWWENNLKTTIAALAVHPAVMGFTIANEVDNGAVDTYGPSSNKAYWWGQVQAMASIAKAAAPGKLVGIANHDDPGICSNCAEEMAQCTNIDFWGVNTYQPQSFSSVFGSSTIPHGYAKLSGAALKPVLLTEYGFPSTTRKTENTLHPEKIISNTETQQNVANILNAMMPQAYAEQLNLGVCYFEYCDEWWNQSEYNIPAGVLCPAATGPYAPNGGNTGASNLVPPNDYTWFGGPVACGFPNYYWDNDGFGLYSVAVGAGRDPSQPWDNANNAPATPLDTRTARLPVISAITAFNGLSLVSGFVTAITQLNDHSTQVAINSDKYGRPPATGTTGSLTNYFYEPGSLSPAEISELQQAYTSGEYVTVTIKMEDEGRSIDSVVVGP
jgi:hypothetical protein